MEQYVQTERDHDNERQSSLLSYLTANVIPDKINHVIECLRSFKDSIGQCIIQHCWKDTCITFVFCPCYFIGQFYGITHNQTVNGSTILQLLGIHVFK